MDATRAQEGKPAVFLSAVGQSLQQITKIFAACFVSALLLSPTVPVARAQVPLSDDGDLPLSHTPNPRDQYLAILDELRRLELISEETQQVASSAQDPFNASDRILQDFMALDGNSPSVLTAFESFVRSDAVSPMSELINDIVEGNIGLNASTTTTVLYGGPGMCEAKCDEKLAYCSITAAKIFAWGLAVSAPFAALAGASWFTLCVTWWQNCIHECRYGPCPTYAGGRQ